MCTQVNNMGMLSFFSPLLREATGMLRKDGTSGWAHQCLGI